MADSPTQPADLIDACGGVTVIAKHFGLPVSTVGSWKARNSIPDDFRPGMVAFAADRAVPGISYEWMTLVHARGAFHPAGAA